MNGGRENSNFGYYTSNCCKCCNEPVELFVAESPLRKMVIRLPGVTISSVGLLVLVKLTGTSCNTSGTEFIRLESNRNHIKVVIKMVPSFLAGEIEFLVIFKFAKHEIWKVLNKQSSIFIRNIFEVTIMDFQYCPFSNLLFQ